METEDINKPGWKPKFTSEYSMGEYDFKRINDTLVEVDRLSGFVNSTDLPNLKLMQDFFAQLKNLYDNFRPLLSAAPIVTEVDNIVKKAKELKRTWENSEQNNLLLNKVVKLNFVDLLNELKTKLYGIKQVIGLGIIVRRNLTTQEKIKRGVRGDRDFAGLPEA